MLFSKVSILILYLLKTNVDKSFKAFAPAVQRTNSGPTSPTPTQLAKLRGDLNIVEENVRVMSEMLTALSPEQEESDDMNLLKVSILSFHVHL